MRYRQSSDGTLIAHENNRKIVQLRPTLKINNIACLIHAYDTLTAYSYHGDTPVEAQDYERAADITRHLIDYTLDGDLVMMGQLWHNRTYHGLLVASLTLATTVDDVVRMSAHGVSLLKLPPTLRLDTLERKFTHAYQESLTCTS